MIGAHQNFNVCIYKRFNKEKLIQLKLILCIFKLFNLCIDNEN